MSDIFDIIQKRRSVRKFKAAQISEAELQRIIEAGRLAPSGSNSQSAHFIVVQNPAIFDELRALVREEFAKMEYTEDTYSSIKNAIKRSKEGKYNFMYNPPTFIIAANRRNYGNAMADCALALGNMMLMATALGIGTCWINQLKWLADNPRLISYIQKLGIGENETICGALSVGYSDQPHLAPVILRGNRVEFVR